MKKNGDKKYIGAVPIEGSTARRFAAECAARGLRRGAVLRALVREWTRRPRAIGQDYLADEPGWERGPEWEAHKDCREIKGAKGATR